MNSSRSALRWARASRQLRQAPGRRFQSSSSSSTSSHSHTQTALYGGLAGAGAAFIGGYAWYHFSGAKTFVNTAHETKAYFQSIKEKTKQAAPPPNEALKWLRQQATFYAGFVPGAKGYIDTTFDDLDTIRNKHGDEVDKIISEAYDELKEVSNKGLSVETASQAWEVLQKHLKRITNLAGDAAQDIINNHPDLKEKVGGNIDQLKSMGKKYGPEAQKVVDDTWSQVQSIIQGGIGVGTIDRIRKLIQEKTEQVQKLGDQAWQKGLEEAKPYLDKAPKAKELIEQNKDALKSGNLSELWDKVRQAVDSGSTDDLKNFVDQTVSKAKDNASSADGGGGGGLEKYLNMVPGGSELVPKLQQLSDISQKHGKEAEKLFKDTVKEVQDVLSKKVEEGKKLADEAGKEAK